MKNRLIILILGCAFQVVAQTGSPCLQEVLDYEKHTGDLNDTTVEKKNIFLSYTVKVTDWDEESTISNVKIHKKGKETRFFSEQVNMYTSDKEIIVEMPGQKIIVLNNALPEIETKTNTDVSELIRKEFLDSCEVLECKAIGKSTKVLVLKVNPRQKVDGIKIIEMRYEYDTELKKVLSVKTTYSPDYKIKTLLMIYRDFNTESAYKFSAFKSQFIDRKGNLTEKYIEYELVDNRDKKTGSSKSR